LWLARLPVVLEAYRGEFLMKTRESKIDERKISERKISGRKINDRWMTVALAIGGGFFGAMLWAQLFAPRSVVAAEAQQSRTINA
jgi:hypothetical protein